MIHKHRDEVGHFTIDDFLTPEQKREALAIYEAAGKHENIAARIAREIIEPNIASIDSRLGQKNDAGFLGYIVTKTFNREKGDRNV